MYYLGKDKVKGRGLYAAHDLKKDQILMECPILKFGKNDTDLILRTKLDNYAFTYDSEHTCILFGYGMMMNHSDTPNVKYRLSNEDLFVFTLSKNVKKGEELCIDYGPRHSKKFKELK